LFIYTVVQSSGRNWRGATVGGKVRHIAWTQLFPPFPPSTSVAKGPKFRRQSTKRADKNVMGPGKSGAVFWLDLSKKGR
jgi:hypothetical protein